MPNEEPSDQALLAECEVDLYRASGPGGQNRNKVETAVRMRHRPTGLMVIAEESRSQAENRARALKRMRKTLALHVRNAVPESSRPSALLACIGRDGRLRVGQRDARYLPAAGAALDVLQAEGGSISAAAKRLGITTGNLSAFLTADTDLMVEVNRMRAGFGLRALRAD